MTPRLALRWAAPLGLVLGACGSDASEPSGAGAAGATASSSSSGGGGSAGGATDEPPLTTVRFMATDEDFANPERGFFRERYQLDVGWSWDGACASLDLDGLRSDPDAALSTVHLNIGLEGYATSELDDAVLQRIEAALGCVRDAGLKAILRFRYNTGQSYGGNCDAFDAEADAAQMLSHVSSLTPVLAGAEDVIATVDAGLIGAWGEWHCSPNFTDPYDPARTDVLMALLDAVPASRAVTIRAPNYKTNIFDATPAPATEAAALALALDDIEAFDSTLAKARVGHLNDCFLQGDSDVGTFDAPPGIEPWKKYVGLETRFVPMTGETCAWDAGALAAAPRTHCPGFEEAGQPSAVDELGAHHWSLLHLAYSPLVIERWKTEGCFAEIARNLGYRFSLQSASVSSSVRPGGVLRVEVTMQNRGYASLFNRRPAWIVMRGDRTVYRAELSSVDPRRWAAGPDEIALSVQLRLPSDAPEGDYRIALWLPDAFDPTVPGSIHERPEYAVRFDNAGVWDAATGENVLLDAVSVDDAAPGAVDPTAGGFVEL